MLVLLCRQASTDCLVLVEVGVGTVSIEIKNAALSLLPPHRQTYSSFTEDEMAANHGHPCTDLAGWWCNVVTVHVPQLPPQAIVTLLYTNIDHISAKLRKHR